MDINPADILSIMKSEEASWTPGYIFLLQSDNIPLAVAPPSVPSVPST
jgi:hypothetical protein